MTDLVAKFGGSLLHQPEGIRKLRTWLVRQSARRIFLIVGGGEAIEAMRDLDRLHSLDPSAMHWRCIRLLDATFEVVRELLPDAEPIDCLKSWLAKPSLSSTTSSTAAKPSVHLVRIAGYFRQEDPEIVPMPENWETTSDALAVLLARKMQIRNVVLLKSCSANEIQSLQEWVEAGVVDRTCLSLCDTTIDLHLETL